MCVFGDGGGGWDTNRREKRLKLHVSILDKPDYLHTRGKWPTVSAFTVCAGPLPGEGHCPAV